MRTKYLMIVIAIPLHIPDFPNCSTAQRFVRNASALGEAIGTGLRGACMKGDYLKRSIALIRTERGYLMKARSTSFSSISVVLMDSHEMVERLAGNGILVKACAIFQGPDGRYVRVAIWTREENQMLMHAVDAVT